MSEKYTPKGFQSYELVPKILFDAMTEREIFDLFDQNLLRDMDTIKELIGGGPVIVNNWKTGGTFDSRGFRPKDDPEGATKSMHREGGAFDFDCYRKNSKGKWEKIPAREVRALLIKNKHRLIAIRRIEDRVSWVHVDNKIHVFVP